MARRSSVNSIRSIAGREHRLRPIIAPAGVDPLVVACCISQDAVTAEKALITAPGTYALVLRCDTSERIPIGRLGELKVLPGWYAYVGSARGPGGLRARVGRHIAGPSVQRWHLDYLRARTSPAEVWVIESSERLECMWARALLPSGRVPLPGFGASDCSCPSHLVFFDDEETLARPTS